MLQYRSVYPGGGKVKINSLSAAIGFAGAVILGAGSPSFAYAQQSNLKLASAVAGGPVHELGALAFGKRIEEMSAGRLKVQVFPGGALGNALKVSETVKNGVADLGYTWMAYDWGVDTTTVLFAGYAGSVDSERMLHWIYEGGGLQLWRQYREEKFGVISIPMLIGPAEVFLHSRKPVRTLEDVKGLKIRTAGAWLDMVKQMGAAPVTMAAGEIFTSLERGVIDAAEWSTPSQNISMGFHKIAKYVIIPGIHQPTFVWELVINKDAWGKISGSDRKLIEDAARLVTFESWLRTGQDDAKALDFYRKAGNEIIELAPEVQYKAREVALAWAQKQAAQNAWFKRVLDSQLAFESLWANAERYRVVKSKPH
jgi:TRAP-type mannitol/chloroaromatic compound transport system substrate-binding protein